MSEKKSDTLVAEPVIVQPTADTGIEEPVMTEKTRDQVVAEMKAQEELVREGLRALYKRAQDAGLPAEPSLPQIDPKELKEVLKAYDEKKKAMDSAEQERRDASPSRRLPQQEQ